MVISQLILLTVSKLFKGVVGDTDLPEVDELFRSYVHMSTGSCGQSPLHALGLPCLVCFARPDSPLWSASVETLLDQ